MLCNDAFVSFAIVCRQVVAFGGVSKDFYSSILTKPLVQVIFWPFTDSSNFMYMCRAVACLRMETAVQMSGKIERNGR